MNKVQVWAIAAAIAALFGGAGVAEAAKMYRWNDENGNPVVSDRPPPQGTPYTEISQQFTADRRRQALRDRPASSADNAAAANPTRVSPGGPIPELCTRARDRIDKLRNAASVAVTDGAGDVRVLSDDERASQLADAQKMAQQHCVD